MRPLMQRLSGSFTTVAIDWPGFGTLPKPYLDWRPAVYEAFLAHVITEVVPDAFGIAAAGHAAGYVIKHFESHDYVARRLVLLSPTWRGPLPTMTGRNSAFFAKIARAFDPPLLGGILYRLNVNRLVIGMMTRGHVYSNPRWLIGGRMEEKLAVTRAPGARHASARFVTGRLDPFDNRQEQMEAARRIAIPTLLMFADTAPPKSRREMQALAALPNVKTVRLTKGKLSFYEEFPEETAAVIGPFLASPASAEPSSDTVTDLL
jgi:pimeloyl-ACP methyl ester carboxylesterase